MPRTDALLTLKLAKKKPKSKRSKKSLDGLYEVLAPGSSVIKSNEHNSIIKEPRRREVTIRSSDLAKFGTETERQTDLRCYAERRPKMPTGKTTEELISRHAKDGKRKIEGDKKIEAQRIIDDMSCVSSIYSNVSRALRVRMPTDLKKTIVPAPPQPPIETVTDFAPPMTLPQTSIVIADSPSRPKRKAATKATTAFPPSQNKNDHRLRSLNLTNRWLLLWFVPQFQRQTQHLLDKKRRQMLKQQQIRNKSIVPTIKNTAARSQNAEQSNFTVGPCLP